MMLSSINPIVPGFGPDPSVVRVGESYFLVTSSFHMFPGLPIYASPDLVSWKHIGNAIHRQSQLSLSRSVTKIGPPSPDTDHKVMLATAGLYAPTIRYHEGTFYIVCTNAIRPDESTALKNFIVSTGDIWSGEWSDLVYFDFQGIDPSILFDDDGKTYIQGSATPGPFTRINCFEIDIKTGKKLSQERTIWEGTGGIYPEGPHVYKRNGWYHLIIAEGGTHIGHMITAARSRDIWGPYESCPNNPILTAHGTDEYIQHTGHGEIFDDAEGQWWAVCLGVRKDREGRFVLGRETFLTCGNWDGEWPSLERITLNPRNVSKQGSSTLQAEPNVDLLYIRDAKMDRYNLKDGGSRITLTPSPVDLSSPEVSPTFVGKRQRVFYGKSSTIIAPIAKSWGSVGLKCGLACYKDEYRFLRIYYDASASAVVIELINKAKQMVRVEEHQLKTPPTSLSLRIEYSEREYHLLYATGEDWTSLAVVDTIEMTDADFVGPVIGIFAVAETSDFGVDFQRFQVD